jgi:hypothetical protein
MTLEIAQRRSLFSARFLQAGGGEPPKAHSHWVGNKAPVTQQQTQGTSNNNNSPKKKNSRGYRDLSTIKLSEVDEAYQFFAHQLLPSPYPSWIARNYFCMIHLANRDEDRPLAVFGRVKTCYPSDGQIQNIREMELSFPHKQSKPDTILLHANEIVSAESYCVRVKFLVSEEEAAEFAEHADLFVQQGFIPEVSVSYIDLLEINEHNHASFPWLFVIGSRWFASMPESIQPEIREKVTKLIHWNKLIFNYHPEYLDQEIRPLNRELGYQAGFTDHFLFEPKDHQQTLQIVAKRFGEIFNQGMR